MWMPLSAGGGMMPALCPGDLWRWKAVRRPVRGVISGTASRFNFFSKVGLAHDDLCPSSRVKGLYKFWGLFSSSAAVIDMVAALMIAYKEFTSGLCWQMRANSVLATVETVPRMSESMNATTAG